MRKNPMIWKTWNPGQGLSLHRPVGCGQYVVLLVMIPVLDKPGEALVNS